MGLDRKGGSEDLGRVKRGETIIRIICMKKYIFDKIGKKKSILSNNTQR